MLGTPDGLVEQRVRLGPERVAVNWFNPTDAALTGPDGAPVPPHALVVR